ncbi:tetratricopeptide repeat protein [Chondromyces crocatus]|nr:tetratricopeptide repeat protein [Chondromyces crocatus]
MEVLTTCKVPAEYSYTGITPKNDLVVIHNADELYANIPVYAAKFEGQLKKAGSLEIAMTIIGRYESNRPKISADELQGECADTTHVITALTVGAFRFSAGASAAVGAGAGVSVGGLGLGGKSASNNETLNTDGDSKACAKATADDKAPPYGCGALLRVELVPLGEARQKAPTCPSGTKWDGSQCLATVTTASAACVGGTILEAGKGCVPPVSGQNFRSALPVEAKSVFTGLCLDAAACAEACDRGQPSACSSAGPMYEWGVGVFQDVNRAVDLYSKACRGGEWGACARLGELSFYGLSGVPKDAGLAVTFFRLACDRGDPSGCVGLGTASTLGTGIDRDSAAAAQYFERACNTKTTLGCVGLGMLYMYGDGVPKDAARAESLFKQACDAGFRPACQLQKETAP